jgi:hypothetical protein
MRRFAISRTSVRASLESLAHVKENGVILPCTDNNSFQPAGKFASLPVAFPAAAGLTLNHGKEHPCRHAASHAVARF